MFLIKLKQADIVFFIVCVALIAIAIAIYYLIPVFKRKQLKEQRENLIKRENAFKSQIKDYVPSKNEEMNNEEIKQAEAVDSEKINTEEKEEMEEK
jgi:ABC-type transport system involved in cytochrome bd biosynthesis fused ATPase/permease subunit